MQLIQTKLISIEAKYANGARKPSFNSTLPFQPFKLSNIQNTRTFKTTLSQNFPMNCHLIQLTRYSTDSKQITCARRLALICRCVGGRTRPWVWQRVTVLLTHGLTRWVAAWIIYRKRKYSSHHVLYFVILKSQTPTTTSTSKWQWSEFPNAIHFLFKLLHIKLLLRQDNRQIAKRVITGTDYNVFM